MLHNRHATPTRMAKKSPLARTLYGNPPLVQKARMLRRRQVNGQDPLRVFVVEDEARVRDAAAEMLADRGMIVMKASKPNQMLRTTERFRPDVIVLDDVFEHSGIVFSKLMPEILQRFPNTRVIVTSHGARSPQTPPEDPRDWGASDVVMKRDILQHKGLAQAVMRVAAGRPRVLRSEVRA